MTHQRMQSQGFKAGIILAALALIILPALPNRTIDPWDLFNPRNFGVLIVTIAAIQFGSYLAIRLFGERFGIALTGLMGGFVSSTAVFANLQHVLNTHPKYKFAVAASAILAVLAMLLEIATIIFVASPELFFYIIKPILVMIIVSFLIAIVLLNKQMAKEQYSITPANPLNITHILRTSLFLAFMVILIAVAKRYVGTEGILIISFLGGLFEIHGISLATALLYLDHHLTIASSELVLYTAITASFISKLMMLWTLTSPHLAKLISTILVFILGCGILTFWWF